MADNVGVEELHETFQVAASASGDEAFGDLMVLGSTGLETSRSSFVLDTAASSAGELAARGRCSPDDFRHIFERESEHVVENEHGCSRTTSIAILRLSSRGHAVHGIRTQRCGAGRSSSNETLVTPPRRLAERI